MIHNLPITDCPFDARLDYKIELAEKMLKNGLVDERDFDEIRQGRTPKDLFRELIESKPDSEDLVFTHGDYCLPNIILENGKLNGFIDWGNAGSADRYQDIALLARSITYNFGAEWTEVLFAILGIKPDAQKIHFYTLLDEFF
jgi:aminoglycoside phosphotransferase